MSALQKRFQVLFSVLSVLLLIVIAGGVYAWWEIRGSLPQLDGERALPGLSAPVQIARDALGVPAITGATRADVARALGFLHAQERYFQMDLLRRSGAGELSELFGKAAVDYDKSRRMHGFRRTAEKCVAQMSPAERAVLEAYTAGVNAGLAALPKIPWEYLVVRTPPQPWKLEDSFLVIFAMWFDLQDWRGAAERNLSAVRQALGTPAMNFFAPPGDSWDAALDGSTFPPAPLPPLRLKPAEEEKPTASLGEPPSDVILGSNAFAVSGAHTANGAAILANDMHLGFSVPHIWYRAEFNWRDERGTHRVDGVTLPGTPAMTVGSNGRVAWGFTDAYVDTTDVVVAETDGIGQIQYRTPRGWVDIEDRPEVIKVKGGAPVNFVARWTEWGPIISGPEDGKYLVLSWTAHAPEATNLTALELETATSTEAAIDIMHRSGIPNENALIADADGKVAWTIIGKIPRRIGYDGRLPVSWAFGDRKWDG
ncbi:MAG: penicillin acylase family protein [Opitutae bacterium]|nr:penicillin acylase family protein [Opitutae bacterium]